MINNSQLEGRMDEFETKLDETLRVVHNIDQGLFGNSKIGYPGVIKILDNHQLELNELKGKIFELVLVNEKQDIAISARKGQTDDFIKWGGRSVMLLVVILLIGLVLTGKVGLADLVGNVLFKK